MKIIDCVNTYEYMKQNKEKFGRVEERSLTKKELQTLHCLCEITIENNFEFILAFAPCSDSYTLFKTPENKWIMMDCDERTNGNIYNDGFDNVYDACTLIINEFTDKEDRARIRNEFDKNLERPISDKELASFAKRMGYYDEYFYYDFQQTIKKMSGIETTEDEEVEERIFNRKKIFYPTDSSFNDLISTFINNIARKLNIDTSDILNDWHHNKIDIKTCEQLEMKRINLKAHQDLVLSELKKYNNAQKLWEENQEENLSHQDGKAYTKNKCFDKTN